MRHNSILCGAFLLTLFSFSTYAQVGIGNTNPSESSLLDIRDAGSNNKGLLIPRVSIGNLGLPAPVASPETSLLVYNTNATTGPGFYYWNGTGWMSIDGGKNWNLSGNALTNAGTDFLGTMDNVDLRFRTNNINRFEIATNGQLRSFANGNNSGPAYSWASNPTTGMFQQISNVIGFSTNGIERFRIPNANQVHAISNGTNTAPFYSWADDTNMGMYRIGTDILGFSTNGVERMRIIANGDVSIGTNNPQGRFHVRTNQNSSGALFSEIAIGNSLWPGGEFYNPNTAGGSGVTGTGFYGVYGQTTNLPAGWAGYFAGDVGAREFYYVSDKRWKSNITPLNAESDMLKKVMLLRPKSYNWRAAEFPGMAFDPDKKSFGFIAQELKEVFPDLVVSKSIPNPKVKKGPHEEIESVSGYYMVDYTGLIPVLTEAIQEQQKIIISQEERISKLESLVQELLNKQ